MAVAIAFWSGVWLDGADFGVFVRFGVSGAVRYRCYSMAAKKKVKSQA
jgi:hypothetical protein